MIRVRIDDERTVRAFRSLDRSSRDLSSAWAKVGADIKGDAAALAPVLTGRLAASLRSGKAKTRATVSAGGARLPYAGVINYGGYNNITATHFLNDALDRNEGGAADEVLNEMQRLIRAAGL